MSINKFSTCVHCGCTDANACVDSEGGGTCRWVITNPTYMLGICSSCINIPGISTELKTAILKESKNMMVIKIEIKNPNDEWEIREGIERTLSSLVERGVFDESATSVHFITSESDHEISRQDNLAVENIP